MAPSPALRFWPLDPNPEKILVEDIAHALAHQCRFGGHASTFYSVAEHSVHVSKLCPAEDALWGLLHDASEAYLVDLARPLKLLPEFAAYREAERRLQCAVAVRFGLLPDQPASVTEADDTMLWIEAHSLLGSTSAGTTHPAAPVRRPHPSATAQALRELQFR
ncbi:MAG: phosphohydrolase [Candidatus Solibacter sp.]